MNFRKLALSAVVFAFGMTSASWAAAVPFVHGNGAAGGTHQPVCGIENQVYCQEFDGTGNAYTSQNDTGGGFGLYAQVYDNFTLGSATNINSVHFVGEYFNPPQQGPITGWTVSIYSDNGGQPGSVLFTQSVAGTGNETFLGDFGGFPTYSYDLAGLNFSAEAGTQYWLSVYPDLAFPPQWGWSSATGGDGISYQDFFGERSQLAADMAFALDGSGQGGVPEPGTLVMMGTGILGLAGVIRRKLG